MTGAERVPVVVVGGGQAGLAVGYYLQRARMPFVILEAGSRVGDAWRQRWDSLRLFTPAFYDALPGLRFPGPQFTWPTKDQMADYLERYAGSFALPIRFRTRVTKIRRQDNGYLVHTTGGDFLAGQVVIAMSSYQVPKIPRFADGLDAGILQLHSHNYRNPAQLRSGAALVVGAGNSGADIAMDLIPARPVFLAGRDVGHLPFRIETFPARYLLAHLARFVGHMVLTVDTPMGRKARPTMLHAATPLVRVKPRDLIAAGVERVARVTGVENGRPRLEDGRELDVSNVIWATGYRQDWSWIDLPIFDASGEPRHDKGIVPEAPGFYFVGLHFLYSVTSATVNGVGRDARRVVRAITGTRGGSAITQVVPVRERRWEPTPLAAMPGLEAGPFRRSSAPRGTAGP